MNDKRKQKDDKPEDIVSIERPLERVHDPRVEAIRKAQDAEMAEYQKNYKKSVKDA